MSVYYAVKQNSMVIVLLCILIGLAVVVALKYETVDPVAPVDLHVEQRPATTIPLTHDDEANALFAQPRFQNLQEYTDTTFELQPTGKENPFIPF